MACKKYCKNIHSCFNSIDCDQTFVQYTVQSVETTPWLWPSYTCLWKRPSTTLPLHPLLRMCSLYMHMYLSVKTWYPLSRYCSISSMTTRAGCGRDWCVGSACSKVWAPMKRRRRRCFALCRGMRALQTRQGISPPQKVHVIMTHVHVHTRAHAAKGPRARDVNPSNRLCDARSSPQHFLLNFIRTYFYFTHQMILDKAMKSFVANFIHHVSILI